MQSTQNLHNSEDTADAYRLAFKDPEFLVRPETRGIRFQLELLKPDLIQTEHGIANTVVVFGSARFKSLEQAQSQFEKVRLAHPDLPPVPLPHRPRTPAPARTKAAPAKTATPRHRAAPV